MVYNTVDQEALMGNIKSVVCINKHTHRYTFTDNSILDVAYDGVNRYITRQEGTMAELATMIGVQSFDPCRIRQSIPMEG